MARRADSREFGRWLGDSARPKQKDRRPAGPKKSNRGYFALKGDDDDERKLRESECLIVL